MSMIKWFKLLKAEQAWLKAASEADRLFDLWGDYIKLADESNESWSTLSHVMYMDNPPKEFYHDWMCDYSNHVADAVSYGEMYRAADKISNDLYLKMKDLES